MWAELICEQRPRAVEGYPDSGFGYTHREIRKACKLVLKTRKPNTELVPQLVLSALREVRSASHVHVDQVAPVAMIPSQSQSTREQYNERLRALQRMVLKGKEMP